MQCRYSCGTGQIMKFPRNTDGTNTVRLQSNFIPRKIKWKMRALNYYTKHFSNTVPMLHYHPSVCILIFLICLSHILLVLVYSCTGPLDKHKNIKTSLMWFKVLFTLHQSNCWVGPLLSWSAAASLANYKNPKLIPVELRCPLHKCIDFLLWTHSQNMWNHSYILF